MDLHAQNLLLQRRVLEELRSTAAKMTPSAMWGILKRVQKESRAGLVTMCSKMIVERPSEALISRLQWLDGISRVRNCFAHRLGIVQMVDVIHPHSSLEGVQESDRLRAVWLAVKVKINGKTIESFPHHGGGKVEVSFDEYQKEWKIGDQIEIDSSECQAISMSLSLFANQLLSEFEKEMNEVLELNAG
jgi:primosomal replication protein N